MAGRAEGRGCVVAGTLEFGGRADSKVPRESKRFSDARAGGAASGAADWGGVKLAL